MNVRNCINWFYEDSVKARYFESHKLFYKLSFEIYYEKNCNSSLSYGELKF
jgi:hypothetical protein